MCNTVLLPFVDQKQHQQDPHRNRYQQQDITSSMEDSAHIITALLGGCTEEMSGSGLLSAREILQAGNTFYN